MQEKRMRDDSISRQGAIDDLHGRDPSQVWDTADVEVWINALPSVQPERKTGQWLPTICNSDGMHHEWCGFHCSICKEATVIRHNYCPRCGAKMERGEE